MTDTCKDCRFGIFIPTAYFKGEPGLVSRNEKVRCRRYPNEAQKLPTDWCGEPMLFHIPIHNHPQLATIEHLREKWRGGSDRMSNLVLAHLICNRRRNAANPKPLGSRLARILDVQDIVREGRQ